MLPEPSPAIRRLPGKPGFNGVGWMTQAANESGSGGMTALRMRKNADSPVTNYSQ